MLAAVAVIATHSKANQMLHAEHTTAADAAVAAVLLSLATAAVLMFFVMGAFLTWVSVSRAVLSDRPMPPWYLQVFGRVIRLYPLYFVLVVVVWSVSNTEVPGHWQDLLLHLSLLHIFSQDYIFWTLGPGWYLAVEIYYSIGIALLGALCAVVARRVTSRGARLGVLAIPGVVLTLGGGAFLVWAVDHVAPDRWSVWFGLPGFLYCLGVGMLLAVAAAAGVTLPAVVRGLCVALGATIVLLAAVGFDPSNPANTLWRLPLTVAAALFVTSVTLTARPPLKALVQPWLVTLGGLSFSIYLVHEPILRLARFYLPLPTDGTWSFLWTFAVVLGVAIPVATLARRHIEEPAARLAQHFDHRGRSRRYYAHLDDTGPIPDHRLISH